MLSKRISIEAVSESSILIQFSDTINSQLPLIITHVAELVYSSHAGSIMNLTPSYTTLLIDYLPYRTSEQAMLKSLSEILVQVDQDPTPHVAETIHLPVYYGHDVAPDLDLLLQQKSMEIQTLIDMHSQAEYTICAIGFTPGFAFLSGLDQQLELPRHVSPRLKVMAGSVGIAGNQTGVYPSVTPGGWNIIGNCPVPLFDPTSTELSPFRVGDKVRFESITRQRFIELGGKVWDF